MQESDGLPTVRYALSIALGTFAVAMLTIDGIGPIIAAAYPPMAVVGALIVALPIALFLRAKDRRNILWAAGVGAAMGAVLGSLGLFSGDVPGLFRSTGMGVLAALIAWALSKFQALPARVFASHRIAVSLAASAMLLPATWLALKLAEGPKDVSCHNIFRSGIRSTPTLLEAQLRMSPSDWPRFRSELRRIAGAANWSIRDEPVSFPRDSGLAAIVGSLCQEPGTQIAYVQRSWAEGADWGVTLRVHAPQGGDGWVGPTVQLFDQLAAVWPDSFAFQPSAGPVEQPIPAAFEKFRRPTDAAVQERAER